MKHDLNSQPLFNYKEELYNLQHNNFTGSLYYLIMQGISRYEGGITGDYLVIEILEKNNYPLCNMESILDGHSIIQMLLNSKMFGKGLELVKCCKPDLDKPDISLVSIREILRDRLLVEYKEVSSYNNEVKINKVVNYDISNRVAPTMFENVSIFFNNFWFNTVKYFLHSSYWYEYEYHPYYMAIAKLQELKVQQKSLILSFSSRTNDLSLKRLEDLEQGLANPALIKNYYQQQIEHIGVSFINTQKKLLLYEYFTLRIIEKILGITFEELKAIPKQRTSLEHFDILPTAELFPQAYVREVFNRFMAPLLEEGFELLKEISQHIYSQKEWLLEFNNIIQAIPQDSLKSIDYPSLPANKTYTFLLKEAIPLNLLQQQNLLDILKHIIEGRQGLIQELKSLVEAPISSAQHDLNKVKINYQSQVDNIKAQLIIAQSLLRPLQDKLSLTKEQMNLKDLEQDQSIEYIEKFLDLNKWFTDLKKQIEYTLEPQYQDNTVYIDSSSNDVRNTFSIFIEYLNNISHAIKQLFPITSINVSDKYFEPDNYLLYQYELSNLNRDTDQIVVLLKSLTQYFENKPTVDESQDLLINKMLTLLNANEFKSGIFSKLKDITHALYEQLKFMKQQGQYNNLNSPVPPPNKTEFSDKDVNIPKEFHALYNEIQVLYSKADDLKDEKMLTLLNILQAKCNLYYEQNNDIIIDIPFCHNPMQYDFSQPLE